MKQRYIVTEKLKRFLNNCQPNIYMEEIRRLKFLTMTDCTENSFGTIMISFAEVKGSPWAYPEDFLEELLKNPSSLKETMEIE